MKTKIVNIRNDEYDVYIGRGSKWGNPFRMKSEKDRLQVLEQYESYARKEFTKEDLSVLVGKTLGCYCHPKKCHGDILIKLMQEYELETV